MKEVSAETDLEDEHPEVMQQDAEDSKEMVKAQELNNNDVKDPIVNDEEVTVGEEIKDNEEVRITEDVRDTVEEKDSGEIYYVKEGNNEELKEAVVMDTEEVKAIKDVIVTEKALDIETSSEEDNDIDMKDIVKKVDEGELNNIVEKMKEIREEVERKKNEKSRMEEEEMERRKEERRKIDSRLLEIAME